MSGSRKTVGAAIIPAIAEGRLTVSTVALLSTHLKTEHGGAILSQALGKTRAEVELLIAERFPKPDVPTTGMVAGTPLVIFPPWINRFYILDLGRRRASSAGRSSRD